MTETLRKLFFKTKMTWPRVIIFSIICGVVPGLLMVPKALQGTSLQQPGIGLEFWIFAAMLIILNCEKPLEAGFKTFVFFLISQPLIYLVQVPFSWLHWQLFMYYPFWGMVTVLTFPGAMLAWYTKKDNIPAVLILSVANLILTYTLVSGVYMIINTFPKLLLTMLFTAAQLVIYPIALFTGRTRLIAFIIIAAMLILCFGAVYFFSTDLTVTAMTELRGTAPFELLTEYEGTDIAIDGEYLRVTLKGYATIPIEVRDAEGNIGEYLLVYDENGTSWTHIK